MASANAFNNPKLPAVHHLAELINESVSMALTIVRKEGWREKKNTAAALG